MEDAKDSRLSLQSFHGLCSYVPGNHDRDLPDADKSSHDTPKSTTSSQILGGTRLFCFLSLDPLPSPRQHTPLRGCGARPPAPVIAAAMA